MAPTVEDVTAKTENIELDPKTGVVLEEQELKAMKANDTEPKTTDGEAEKEKGDNNGVEAAAEPKNGNVEVEEKKEEAPVPDETEPKTGVTFPVRLDDGKQLNAVGVRKKSMLGMGLKIYGFGLYADNEKLKDLLRSKIGKAPTKPTKEMYQLVVDCDAGMMVRLVIVFSNLTMNMVRKNFDEGLGAAIKKLTGGKNDELTKKIMGEASDDIKLSSGSVIEISRQPGFILQTKVKGEIVSTVESELLCRAFIHMYLGDDPFDKEAKEKFGMSLLPLF